MKRGDIILCKFPHSSTVPAKCINVAVIPPRNVDRKIGELSEAAMNQIDECLKVAFGID